MHRFFCLTLIATFLLLIDQIGNLSKAQDVDELLSENSDWAKVPEDEKSEVGPVLEILVRDVIDKRPLLDPSKAYHQARERVDQLVAEIVQSRDGSLRKALKVFLSQLASGKEKEIDISFLQDYRDELFAAIEGKENAFPRLRRYMELAKAMEAFLFLDKWKNDYKTPADYNKLLGELKEALIAYAAAPSTQENRNELGKLAALLKVYAKADQSANIDDLLSALRKLCKKPNIWVYASEDLINEFVDSLAGEVYRPDPEPVDECILGTSIQGTAQICADMRIAFHPATSHAALTLHLDGTAISNTVGYQKPVRIVSKGHTTFSAQKSLSVPDLATGCATASACTDTTICSIKKVGRRILSRLIERIAWKRARQQESQAEAIASQKFARQLECRINERLDPIIEIVRKFVERWLQSPLRGLGLLPDEFKFSTTSNELKVGAAYVKPEQIGAPPGPVPVASGQNDLTVMIHLDFIKTLRESNKVRAQRLDTLVSELLAHITDPKSGAMPLNFDLHVLEFLRDKVDIEDFDSSTKEELKNELENETRLKFLLPHIEAGWLVIQFQLQ